MDKNYTPLDVSSFQRRDGGATKESNGSQAIQAVFMTLIVITLGVLAVLLLMLIQKKIQELAYIPLIA